MLLTAFKAAYGRSMALIRAILGKFCPEMDAGGIQGFIYVFFPFMFGIYPYARVTDKQRVAMKDANVNYTYQSIYELTRACLVRLLGE